VLDPLALAVSDASQVGEVRRAASALAARLGFGATLAGRVCLVATEAANNLVKHARDGVILMGSIEGAGEAGVEILALDRGPGMADVGRCARDGYSTAGSPGTGLGAVLRLSSFADVYSVPDLGTAPLARLGPGAGHAVEKGSFHVAALSVPKAGETECGDSWSVESVGGRTVFVVADGLGHGPLAADASRTAVRVFRENPHLAPAELLRKMHAALRATRGAEGKEKPQETSKKG